MIRLELPQRGVALITIDRPEQRNALRAQDMLELTECLRRVADDEAVHAAVLTGNGAFCAGADLGGLKDSVAGGPIGPRYYDRAHALVRSLLNVPVPTIAAVDGPAVGMGADLALACDSRLIGPGGWLRQGWAARGLIPGTGGLLFLRKLSPAAVWHLLDGQPKVDGLRAERLGIGEAVERASTDAALDRAGNFAAIPRQALEAYVRFSRRDVMRDLDEELAEIAPIQAALFNRPQFVGNLERPFEAGAQ